MRTLLGGSGETKDNVHAASGSGGYDCPDNLLGGALSNYKGQPLYDGPFSAAFKLWEMGVYIRGGLCSRGSFYRQAEKIGYCFPRRCNLADRHIRVLHWGWRSNSS